MCLVLSFKSPMFVIKADAWFAPAEHCLCIPAWQRIGIYHQNNPRNIHKIFKWLKTECVSSLSPPTPNCIQFWFMLLHRAAKTLELCLPMINTGTCAGNSACSQKWSDLKWQCSESSRGRSFWRDMEIRDGRLERITFPLPVNASHIPLEFLDQIYEGKNSFTMATLNWETMENCWFDSIVKHTELFWTRHNSTKFCFNLV